jgi:hypothetical protein
MDILAVTQPQFLIRIIFHRQEPPLWVKENKMWIHEEAEKWIEDYYELDRKELLTKV